MHNIRNIKKKKINISNWKEYSLEKIFFSEVGDFDIQKKHIGNNGEIVVSSGVTNSGIVGKTIVEAKIFDENTITVDMFGNSYFRNYKYKMVTHGRVFSLKMYQQKKPYVLLFLATILNKVLPMKYNYNNMCSWNKIMQEKILLPSIFNEKINEYEPDWDYMEKYIELLEKEIFN